MLVCANPHMRGMPKPMKSRIRFLLSCACALYCATVSGFAQTVQTAPAAPAARTASAAEKPRLAVFGFLNQTGDDSFSIPAETASTNLFITMKMLNLFQASEFDTVPRNLDDESLERWCARNSEDFAVFGTVQRGEGGLQTYQLSYFSRAAKRVTDRKTASGSSVLDVFSAVDTLTDAMLPTISDNKISFGSLKFVKGGVAGDYDVWLDGVYIQTNPSKFDRVPSGSHEIRIVRKSTGQDAFSQTVAVVPKKTETVQFEFKDAESIPPVAVAAAAAPAAAEANAASSGSDALDASREIRTMVAKDLYKNYDAIAGKAKLLPSEETGLIYATYEKKSMLPAAVNALVAPVTIGSFMQGDINGGLMGTALRVGGISAMAWFIANYAGNSNPGPVGLVFLGGFGTFLGGYFFGVAEPYFYSSSYNKTLKSALGILPAPQKVSPAVSIVPSNKSFNFSLGMKAEY